MDARKYSFEKMLCTKGYIVYTNVGCSMMPLLREKKDIIEIRPLQMERERCKKYDVVLYKRSNIYILHRVLKVTPTGYIIAGDHNTFKEYDVTDDMILGVMTRVIRDGKSIYPTDWRYKIYSHLWVDFYPIRVLILKLKAKERVMVHRLIGK